MILRALALAVAFLLSACASLPPGAASRPPVILISIDGFRADYLDRGVTPVIAGLAAGGARAEGMRPSHPSLTFPNHYTLVTGLRPDRHGIVDNTMTDPARPGVTFSLGNAAQVTDRFWWDDATPIGVTAERAGIATATMFWPGSEAAIQGVRPRYWTRYDQTMPAPARVDQLLVWLDAPGGSRPGFLTLYFDKVDTVGHNAGPDSPELLEALAATDQAIGRLVDGLRALGIAANLILVADHGMVPTSAERLVLLDDLLPADTYRTVTGGPTAGIVPAPGQERRVTQALLRPHPHMACYPRAELPARLAYGAHRRVPPILCLAETGWLIGTRGRYARQPPGKGAHGYDPADLRMAALFVANGPAFRPGVVLPVFDNVSVYPLLAGLLGISPEPHQGRSADLRPALRR